MLLSNQKIISIVHSNFILSFDSLFLFTKDVSRFNLWIESRKNREKSLFKLTVLALQCIESWNDSFRPDTKGNFYNFQEVYNKFREQNIEFPPSFFLKSFEPLNKKTLKRDLSKVRSFCKEFELLINTKSVFRVKILKKILFSYEKTLNIHMEKMILKGNDPDNYFKETMKRVKSVVFNFLLWKSSNFTELFDPKCKVSIVIPDPVPKLEPEIENSRELNNDLSSSKSSLSEIEDIIEDLDHKEGLSSMYKQDLSSLQENYLKISEEKELIHMKNIALEVQARDLQLLLQDQKKIISEFSEENDKLKVDNDKIIQLNDFLTSKVEEMNSVIDKLEKSKLHNLKLVENLENANELLLLSNKHLKEDLAKLKINEEILLSCIKSKNLSFDPIEINEQLKNSPNDSVGSVLNRSKFCNSDRSVVKISSVDTLADYDAYDNEIYYFKFLVKGSGIIFEDEKMKVLAEFCAEGKRCDGVLKVLNKLEGKLKILIEICGIPKEFKQFSMPSGGFKIKGFGEVEFPVSILCSKVFMDSPMIKVTYVSIYMNKFLKIPLTPLVYLCKLDSIEKQEFGHLAQKVLTFKSEQWKSLKKSFCIYGKRIRSSKHNTHKIESSYSSIFGKVGLDISYEEGKLKINVLACNKLVANALLQNISMMISRILQIASKI